MNKEYIYVIGSIIIGIISLLYYRFFPYSKEEDHGYNFTVLAVGITGILGGVIMLLKKFLVS